MMGTATFNGQPMSKSIRRSIGYVAQDDLLHEDLTVYETLYYAALLRLPKHMTREAKLERVEAVISALGLNKCRDTLIGESNNHSLEHPGITVGVFRWSL